MNIWKEEKKFADIPARTPVIKQATETTTFRTTVEESLANAITFHRAYTHHGNEHLFRSGLLNSFVKPLREAVKDLCEHSYEAHKDVPICIYITAKDLSKLGETKQGFPECIDKIREMLRDQHDLDISYGESCAEESIYAVYLKLT